LGIQVPQQRLKLVAVCPDWKDRPRHGGARRFAVRDQLTGSEEVVQTAFEGDHVKPEVFVEVGNDARLRQECAAVAVAGFSQHDDAGVADGCPERGKVGNVSIRGVDRPHRMDLWYLASQYWPAGGKHTGYGKSNAHDDEENLQHFTPWTWLRTTRPVPEDTKPAGPVTGASARPNPGYRLCGRYRR